MAIQFRVYYVEIEADVMADNGFFAGSLEIADESTKHFGNGLAFFAGLVFSDAMNHRCPRRNSEPIRLDDVVFQFFSEAIGLHDQPGDADDSQFKPLAWMIVGFGVYEDEAHNQASTISSMNPLPLWITLLYLICCHSFSLRIALIVSSFFLGVFRPNITSTNSF